eukprot:CAMPEP_0185779154 /NCGR_PEP_ID=MMETSP1174-20130828/94869_1 /TAXON_ID=35687 /ORGANISM="Dictyocha speculum, Strain CCMP1381" /LENGTH=59 /DNA_ID=CAMNT_0028468167 /DNA_START=865 /DNA_END=1044 /DNA_ORIENTATION=-
MLQKVPNNNPDNGNVDDDDDDDDGRRGERGENHTDAKKRNHPPLYGASSTGHAREETAF